MEDIQESTSDCDDYNENNQLDELIKWRSNNSLNVSIYSAIRMRNESELFTNLAFYQQQDIFLKQPLNENSSPAEGRKPRGYWSRENCLVEAKNYKTRSEFCQKSVSAYNASWRGKWLNEICQHMTEDKDFEITEEMRKACYEDDYSDDVTDIVETKKPKYEVAFGESKPIPKEMKKPKGYWTRYDI